MTRRSFLLCAAAPSLAACVTRSTARDVPTSYLQRGLASWYGEGDGYHGRQTASGERFDKNGLTAAHYDLPFGTYVQVRNLRNDRLVEVRINDRIPVETLNRGRVLDVSYGAAQRLRMVRDGVVPVEITLPPQGSRTNLTFLGFPADEPVAQRIGQIQRAHLQVAEVQQVVAPRHVHQLTDPALSRRIDLGEALRSHGR